MREILISSLSLICFAGAGLGALYLFPRSAEHQQSGETAATIRHIAGFFVVVSSLVFGLMISSAKTTFEAIDANMHGFATELILFDKALKSYGTEMVAARKSLSRYVQEAIDHPTRADDALSYREDVPGKHLDEIGDTLSGVAPADSYQQLLLTEIRQQYHRIVERRWSLVEQSEGNIPMPLIGMLIAWLTLIFMSMGYRAPPNTAVVTCLITAATLAAASIYLVLDMDIPFAGTIQISVSPLRRALAAFSL
ncbi:MAG TPA: hypothetical protein VFS04_08880 [Alphaproteobacteria bacterium]|nr:hypothetical protein [Alphaproteobacteria bacterium]